MHVITAAAIKKHKYPGSFNVSDFFVTADLVLEHLNGGVKEINELAVAEICMQARRQAARAR